MAELWLRGWKDVASCRSSANRGTARAGKDVVLVFPRPVDRNLPLQSLRGGAPQFARDAGDDQVGALRLCSAVCPVRSDAGGQWRARPRRVAVDYCRDGGGAVGGDGFQSPGGCL